jgi:hypothetical protein
MVQDIGELHCKSGTYTFREFDVLGDCGVQVPSWQAAEVAHAAASRVKPQNATPEAGVDRSRIGKHVDAFRINGAYSVGTENSSMG